MKKATIIEKFKFPQNWQLQKIEDTLIFQEGPGVRKHQFRNKGVKLLNVANLKENNIDLTNSSNYISEEEAYGAYSHFLVDEGDLIIASSGVTLERFKEKIAFVNKENLPLCLNTSTIRFKVKDERELEIRYFMWFLRSKYFSRQVFFFITGSAQLNFGPSHLKQMYFPYFNLGMQKRIVDSLDKADKILRKRQESIKLADEFLRSTFIEMFGDPYLNSMGWKKEKCENLFEMKLGKMLSARNYTGNHLKPYLRNVNVQWGKIVIDDVKEMDFDEKEFSIYKLEKGDILVCEGGEVGKTAIFNGEIENCGFQNALHRLRIKDFSIINREYFLYFMIIAVKSGILKKETISVTIAHFTLEKFRKFKIPVPPIEIQNKFSLIVEKTEKLKAKYQQSLEESENLFNSLMQRAFKGEL